MNDEYYDFTLRFYTQQFNKAEMNRVLNKVRSLLINEGMKLERQDSSFTEQKTETKAPKST